MATRRGTDDWVGFLGITTSRWAPGQRAVDARLDLRADCPPPGRGFGGGAPVPPGGRGGLPMFGRGGGDVLHRQVGEEWPLIRRILEDDVYLARYREALEHASGGLLAPEAFERRARTLHALIASAALAERPTPYDHQFSRGVQDRARRPGRASRAPEGAAGRHSRRTRRGAVPLTKNPPQIGVVDGPTVTALASFLDAPPDLLEKRLLQRRVDRKFVFAADLVEPLLAHLSAHFNLVRAATAQLATYHTVYFDTLGRQMLREPSSRPSSAPQGSCSPSCRAPTQFSRGEMQDGRHACHQSPRGPAVW